MQIAINNSPLSSAHKHRGIGYYTSNLIRTLKKDPSITVREFVKLSEVKKADILHYPWFDFYFHTLPIKRIFPTIVTIHDVIPLVFPQHYPVGLRGKLNFILQKIALKNCKFIITDSQASKEDIKKFLKVKEGQIIVIPLAADSQFQPLSDTKLLYVKRKYNLPDQFLLYVGDANWVKNLPFLIEGFKELIKNDNFSNVKLILVGGVFLKNVENINHPELESLKKVFRLIKDHGLEDKIIRPGNIEGDDLTTFYNLATVYIQPSLYEGFGLPVLEALSCGTSVVSSNRGSLAEVGGNAALYFDPSDLKQFVNLIKEVVEYKSIRSKLRQLGFKQAAKFSWDKVGEETKKVYMKVINEKL